MYAANTIESKYMLFVNILLNNGGHQGRPQRDTAHGIASCQARPVHSAQHAQPPPPPPLATTGRCRAWAFERRWHGKGAAWRGMAEDHMSATQTARALLLWGATRRRWSTCMCPTSCRVRQPTLHPARHAWLHCPAGAYVLRGIPQCIAVAMPWHRHVLPTSFLATWAQPQHFCSIAHTHASAC